MAKLSPKQKKFCEHYAKLGNATEAAKLAGYSEKTAQEIGAQNLSKLIIQDCLKSLTKADTDTRIMDATERQQLLTKIARNDTEQTKDRLKALDLLCKVQGDYSDAATINNVIMPTVIEIIDG